MDRQPVANRFKNKVAIVTGGASGIGRAIAEELCREGCAVCITGISEAGKATATGALGCGTSNPFPTG